MNTPDPLPENADSGSSAAQVPKSRKRWLQATQCEAFLVSAFELLNAQCGSIGNGPETMHRRVIAGVEVDVLLQLKDGRQVFIFLDGARYHGADPKINGGAVKIASDNERRATLIVPGVQIINVRERPLPPLVVGENQFVSDLCSNQEKARACADLCLSIWGGGSAEVRMVRDPAFVALIRQRCADYWFPRLSESVPEERKLRNVVTPTELADLISRSTHPDAAGILPELGRSSKGRWNWRCQGPKCGRVYSATVGGVLADTKSKGCPFCGGSKIVAPENSVAADPNLSRDFIEVCGEAGLGALDVSKHSDRIMAWRCRNPACKGVCLDRPRNRILSTGLCMRCGRINRRFARDWVPQEIQLRVRSAARRLTSRYGRVNWNFVFSHLAVADQQYLTRRKPVGDALSKWGFKQIKRALAGECR